jgi:hypothetical protein
VITANTAARSIITVAVLEIHIEIKYAVNINPNKRLEGLFPVIVKILSAIRLCNPEPSIANAIKNHPINKNNIGSIYCAATTLKSQIPSIGNKRNGSNDVTAR